MWPPSNSISGRGDSEIWMWRLRELTPPGPQPPASWKICTSAGTDRRHVSDQTGLPSDKGLNSRSCEGVHIFTELAQPPALCLLMIVIVHGGAHDSHSLAPCHEPGVSSSAPAGRCGYFRTFLEPSTKILTFNTAFIFSSPLFLAVRHLFERGRHKSENKYVFT